MSQDITMCKGKNCLVKEKCYRYTAKPNEYRQSYFLDPPYNDDGCDYFWGENQEQVWDRLKDITNGSSN